MGIYISGLEMPTMPGNYYGRFSLLVSESGNDVVSIDGKMYKCCEINSSFLASKCSDIPYFSVVDENKESINYKKIAETMLTDD